MDDRELDTTTLVLRLDTSSTDSSRTPLTELVNEFLSSFQ